MTTRDLPTVDQMVEDAGADTPRSPNRRSYEVAVAVSVIALGVLVYVMTSRIDVAREGQQFGPRWWPTALAVAMIVIGLGLALQSLLSRITSDEPTITASGGFVLAATLATIVVYGFAWQYLDFRLVTVFLLAAITAISGGRGVKALAVFPIVTTAILWLIFGLLLQVPL
ncbi:tripartite tricarboxylate transporter TctB family protein [Rhodococcus sp. IEGM 1341]|uniref:tripartite tricarboxylate transporter TctB family protein n=1 Tax=Rhodococcus sp. IEGM 1341 TaxID=3047090 RepID=UPI0024B719D2|nr:tripartite tricarboxylate transporter TctB family protein [Rhodococcus sp. IEGM 1341]MDI9927288.1 tripartite tricarboxylate transporter TctB family protein [Rhodococcus sp. IEGM 1341]